MGKKILVVDDDRSTLTVVRNILQAVGYEVVAVKNATECFKRIKAGGEFDLVLLDLMMPDVDGNRTFKLLDKVRPNTKVIFMSAVLPSEEIIRYQKSKGIKRPYITKPFTKDKLLGALREALGEK
ncbi:MAG: response regulator [Candidatus Altiarchaeales archaeon]|nr:response regulator [Candidatus Altiarchaeales archaeon]